MSPLWPPTHPLATWVSSPACHTAAHKSGAHPLGRTKAENYCGMMDSLCCAATRRTPVRYCEMPSLDRDANCFLKEEVPRERKVKRLEHALLRHTLGLESIVLPFLSHRWVSEIRGVAGAPVRQPARCGTALCTHPHLPLPSEDGKERGTTEVA